MTTTVGNTRPADHRNRVGGWVVTCVCGKASGPRATKRGVLAWADWHRSDGCEGCDHVTSTPEWVEGRLDRILREVHGT